MGLGRIILVANLFCKRLENRIHFSPTWAFRKRKVFGSTFPMCFTLGKSLQPGKVIEKKGIGLAFPGFLGGK